MKFKGTEKSAVLDGYALFKNCSVDIVENNLNPDERFDCLLNVRLARDSRIILGEPFIKQHYTIFDQ